MATVKEILNEHPERGFVSLIEVPFVVNFKEGTPTPKKDDEEVKNGDGFWTLIYRKEDKGYELIFYRVENIIEKSISITTVKPHWSFVNEKGPEPYLGFFENFKEYLDKAKEKAENFSH